MSTSENALVTIGAEQSIIAAGGLGFGGRMFQLKPANITLVQNTTRDALPGQTGKFRITATGEVFDELTIVLLRPPQESRVLFPPGSDLGSEALCRSNDGLVPADNAAVPQAPRCGYFDNSGRFTPTCEHASWKAWTKNKTSANKPGCQQKYRLLFVERTTKVPLLLTLGGKSIRPIVDAMQHVARLAEVLRSQGKNPNIFDFTMKMKAVKVEGKKGSYFVAGFSDIATIRDEDRAKFGELYVQFANRTPDEEAAEAEQELNNAATENPTVVDEA